MPRRSRHITYNPEDDISTLSSNTIDSVRIYWRRAKSFSLSEASIYSLNSRSLVKYFTIACSGVIAFTFVSLSETSLRRYASSSMSSIYEASRSLDSTIPYAAYSTLQNPKDIDNSVERRANEITSYYDRNPSKLNSRCDNIMIYMPDSFAFHGHGSQINTYLMAVMVSTYLDRPLLLLEPSGEYNKYEGGSQFGCPETMVDQHDEIMEMPNGFSRLIDHPAWLHNGCRIPTCHEYGVWNQMSSKFNPEGHVCRDSVMDRDINSIVTRAAPLRGYVRQMYNEMTSNTNPDVSLRWALNLGAAREEAQRFVEIRRGKEKWDYAVSLMVKSGVLKLQPWIARDVQQFLESVDLPFDEVFDGVHVRRGDKLETESRGPVVEYWASRGFNENNMPLNFIPFSHYLNQWNRFECPLNSKGESEIVKHHVYVATDDPVTVKQEIERLIAEDKSAITKSEQTTGPTILHNGCHLLTFYFNPASESPFHLGGYSQEQPIEGDNCSARYHRNIAGMADLLILARSRTFIGEYNSNWGKLLRAMRMRLTDVNPFSAALDMRIAWGRDTIGGHGF